MKGRIEYEFEVDFNRGEQHDLDIFEFIEEDVEKAIEDAIDDIIFGVKKIAYRVVRI